jgi:hypothetical protein
VRTPIFGAAVSSGIGLGVGQVSWVLKRSVLLSSGVVPTVVLIGPLAGFIVPSETSTPFRTAWRAISSPHRRGFSILILVW